LVLGAGGVVGAAFHAGALAALAEAGFDARDASIIVGTSAGSGVGATLRAGFPPSDLAARNMGRPLSPEARTLVERTSGPPAIHYRQRPFSRLPVPSSPGLLLRSARRPRTALVGLLPTGTASNDLIRDRIGELYGDVSWPVRPLWVCAVDLDRGDRVVFGRDELEVPVGVAVQASSSIPGLVRPVVHCGRRYVDGGVHSPTNADLLEHQGLDLVVVVSPMSTTRAGRRASLASARPLHAGRLAAEVADLRRAGTEVLTFQPTAADIVAMGRNPLDLERRAATTEAAFASTRHRLTDPNIAERLEILRASSA
jgi:NTE family protein